ncbi:hypothetical protein [Microbacterium aurum]
MTDLMRTGISSRDFDYDKTATTVTSGLPARASARTSRTSRSRAARARCRRTVRSGYLATQPPPGKERVFGADASHALLAVWLPY